jgi:hypothetical protein
MNYYYLLFIVAFNPLFAQTIKDEKPSNSLIYPFVKKQLPKKEFSLQPIQLQKTAQSAIFCRMEEKIKRKYNLNLRIRTGGY